MKNRKEKFKALKYGHPINQRLRYFLEGFINCKNGYNFSMTPYPQIGNTSYGVDNQRMKRKFWSRGYWAAVKSIKSKKE